MKNTLAVYFTAALIWAAGAGLILVFSHAQLTPADWTFTNEYRLIFTLPENAVVTNKPQVGLVIAVAKRDGWITNLVNELVASGEFCRIKGHVWFTPMHLTVEYRTAPFEERKCQICGTLQSREMPGWPTP